MKRLTSWLAVGLCASVVAVGFAATANAQGGPAEASLFTLTEPVNVGGTILQPGDYVIKVVSTQTDRKVVQVWSADKKTLFTTLLTVLHPEGSRAPARESRLVYYPAKDGQVKALKTWFSSVEPGRDGHDIIYSKRHATELAVVANEPVIAVPDEVKEAELITAPLVVVTPEKEEKPYEPEEIALEEPPVRVADNSSYREPLPQTASDVPLYAGIGLLSLLGALALGALARRVA